MSRDEVAGACIAVCVLWVILGLVVGATAGDKLERVSGVTPRAVNVGMTLAGIFSPFVLPLAIPVGIFLGTRWLLGGLVELYRAFFPKKVKLPEARVLK